MLTKEYELHLNHLLNKGTKMNTNQNFTSPFEVNQASENVSDKYKFISSKQFITDVQSLGYKLERTSSPRRGLGKHSMVFSHPDMPSTPGLGLHLLAVNSHDATSAFRLYVQLNVAVCANALVAFIPDLAKGARVIHRGYALDRVAGAVDAVRSRIDYVLNTTEQLQTTLARNENTHAFLLEAAKLRDAKPYRLTDLMRMCATTNRGKIPLGTYSTEYRNHS